MDLLFISNVYASPTLPGKGAFNVRMVHALRAIGHRVGVICPVAWTDVWRADRAKKPRDSDAPNLNHLERFPTYYFTPRILRRAYGWFMWRSIKSAVDEVAGLLKPQAVLGYWVHPDGRCAVEAARRLGVPSIVMTGGSDVLLLTRNRARRRVVLDVLTDADAIIAVSDDLRSKLVQAGVPAQKVHLVRRGVDLQNFSSGDRDEARRYLGVSATSSVLVWVGRMTAVKGLSVLVEALDQLRHGRVNVEAYLIGSGELMPALRADVQRRGLESSVHFVGTINDQSLLAKWYRAGNLTVLPSYSEGVPNVLLESISCGTPFVASKVGGVPEIATPGLDRLVAPGQSKELADAIRTLIHTCGQSNVTRCFTPSSIEQAGGQLMAVFEQIGR